MMNNPILHEYLSTDDSMDMIVQKFYNQNQYLESVFNDLTKAVHQKEINPSLLLSIDKAIIKGHPDQNIYLFFISTAMTYYRLFNQTEKARSLSSIGYSFLSDEIHPMIKAGFIQSYAKLKRYEGEINESMKLMKESISLVNKSEPRYGILIDNFFSLLASQGQLNETNEYTASQFRETSNRDQNLFNIELKIINCVNTAEYQKGLEHYIFYTENEQKEKLHHRFEFYYQLLQVISGNFDESIYQNSTMKLMVNTYLCLSSGKIEEANKYYQKIKLDDLPHGSLNAFVDYLPLHIEICREKKGMAALLLQEKTQKGNVHYLDDLFYGRIQLLANDIAGANQSFSRLTENITRYSAMKRLIFELQFAKEMKLPDVLRLINGWKSTPNEITVTSKTLNPVQTKRTHKGLDLLIGRSRTIKQVKSLVEKYASLKAPVLITGETGTGKELVSKAIHDEGANPNEPFLAINCGALTDTLLQSELFGYEAGAFTGAQKQRKGIFEAAGKGTVFLDEFGDISPKLQVSLLRVLEANEIRLIGSTENRKIECKIVVATNVDLHAAVVSKKFREDLFFRLARFEIKLPSLQERLEDLQDLIDYFLSNFSSDSGKIKTISKELLKALSAYHWPGNIRELKNEIERLYILNPDQEILGVEHFDFNHLQESIKSQSLNRSLPIVTSNQAIKEDSVLKVIQKGFPIEKRHSLIKDLFKEYKKLTRSQIMEIAKIGAKTATKDLQILIDNGTIVRRSPTKSSRTDYFELKE